MPLFSSIIWDVRYAFRSMRSSIGLTVVAILSLALAIGATVAIFSAMYALILRPLPVFEPDRLVEMPRSSDGVNLHSYSLWKKMQGNEDVFSSLLAYYAWDEKLNLTDNEENENLAAMYVSGEFFQTLGVPAIVGRTLTEADDRPGAAPACVIGYSLWMRRFGKSPDVLGRTVVLKGHAFRVVGVTPRTFFGIEVGKRPEVFLPLEMFSLFGGRKWPNGVPMPTLESNGALSFIGRLKPGVTVTQADARMRVLGTEIYRALPPDGNPSGTLTARALASGMSRSYFSETVLLLMIMAGAGMTIAGANLGNLLLARATRRQGEIATRIALGATRSRLVRQLMTESVVLAVAAAALGLVIKSWASQALLSVISFSGETTVLDLSWDAKLIGFVVGLTLAAAILFGLAPAIRASRLPLYADMQSGSATLGGRNRLSNAVLIVVQVSLSIALFYSAGLLARTMRALIAKDPGYEAKGVLVAQVSLEGRDEHPQRAALEGEEILHAFRLVPGVTSVSWLANFSRSAPPELRIPTSGGHDRTTHGAYRFYVSPDFLNVRRTPMLAGRDFNDGDSAQSTAVAILSEQAARTFFPGVNPIGLSFRENDEGIGGQAYSVTVLGIAKNIDFQGPAYAPLPILYRPVSQCSMCAPTGRYELRFAGPARDLTTRLRTSAAGINPNLSIQFHPLTDEFDEGVQRNRAIAWMAALFALFAGILSMIGVYGVTSYAASQRTREVGIRIALGARPSHVFRMIVGETATVVFMGIALGVPVAYGAAQVLRGMLWGVKAADTLALVAVSLGMLLVAALAAFLPARRAMRIDPMACLRYE